MPSGTLQIRLSQPTRAAFPDAACRAKKRSVSKYIDLITCIGCKACNVACVEWNDRPILQTAFDNTYQTMPHTAWNYWNHRRQQMAMLRMLGRDLHSNYGPTADTGGLMQNQPPTIHASADVEALLEGEDHGGAKSPLPGPPEKPVTERPGEGA